MSDQTVIVTDIRMPFWSIVVFLVKLAIAAIPALIILVVFWGIIAGVVNSIGKLHGGH